MEKAMLRITYCNIDIACDLDVKATVSAPWEDVNRVSTHPLFPVTLRNSSPHKKSHGSGVIK